MNSIFYAVMGPDHLSLEVSRDFDGERLLDYLFEQLGASEEPPRTQVGGRQDEEEGALLLVEWRFPADGRPAMLRRLEEIMGQSLAELGHDHLPSSRKPMASSLAPPAAREKHQEEQ